MLADLKMRLIVLTVAGLLVAGAVAARMWLAATGSYSQGSVSVPWRVASGAALAVGFCLAAAAVAWPVRKAGRPAGEQTGSPRS